MGVTVGSLGYTCNQNGLLIEKQLCPYLWKSSDISSKWKIWVLILSSFRRWKLYIQFSKAFKCIIKQISLVHHLVTFMYLSAGLNKSGNSRNGPTLHLSTWCFCCLRKNKKKDFPHYFAQIQKTLVQEWCTCMVHTLSFESVNKFETKLPFENKK